MNGSGPSMTTRIDRDGPLVAALRRGDPTAAEDLVAAYGDRAWRLATRITGNAQDAEEAVQDAFLSVIRKIDTFRGDSAFRSWLYRIVANAAYQHCRRRRGRSADVSLDQLLPVFDEARPPRRTGRRLVDERRRPGSPDRASDRAQHRHRGTARRLPRRRCCCATSRGFHSRKPLRPSAFASSTSRRVCHRARLFLAKLGLGCASCARSREQIGSKRAETAAKT